MKVIIKSINTIEPTVIDQAEDIDYTIKNSEME
jgi:hypothetical protein